MSNSKNKNLSNAKKSKNDEFYTLYEDIEKELMHYTKHFENKVVYCNCDNPKYSNFWKYFRDNFNNLKLNTLVCTYYNPNGYSKLHILKSVDGIHTEKVIDLTCNGDFRNPEMVKYIKKIDILVTNSPFSLFRDFISQIMEYGKKFLVIGNMNAITYQNVFQYIKNNNIWLGVTTPKKFILPDGRMQTFGNINWYTNLEHTKRNKPLELTVEYTPELYPKYDNYDAIEVSKVVNIPKDYYGVIGVPISFLSKYNPEQFEIIKFRKGNDDRDLAINGSFPYFRILIKRKQ